MDQSGTYDGYETREWVTFNVAGVTFNAAGIDDFFTFNGLDGTLNSPGESARIMFQPQQDPSQVTQRQTITVTGYQKGWWEIELSIPDFEFSKVTFTFDSQLNAVVIKLPQYDIVIHGATSAADVEGETTFNNFWMDYHSYPSAPPADDDDLSTGAIIGIAVGAAVVVALVVIIIVVAVQKRKKNAAKGSGVSSPTKSEESGQPEGV